MASSSEFWSGANSAAETIGKSVCWPVYGVIDDAANSRWDKAAGDLLCPTGVGNIVDAVECWEAGKAVSTGLDLLHPGLIPGGPSIGSILEGTGAEQGITETYCWSTGDARYPTEIQTNNPTTEAELPKTEQEEARDARELAGAENDASRLAAYKAARNSGAGRAASAAMAGSEMDPTNNSNALASAKNASSYTQNDWLQKQGYAQGLANEAANKKKGAFMNTLSGIFGGAGTGASTGASLGGK